jgi:hypothetical protein
MGGFIGNLPFKYTLQSMRTTNQATVLGRGVGESMRAR